jgi:thioredoxin reductase
VLAGKSVVVVGGTSRALRGVSELARTAAEVYLVLPDAGAETDARVARARLRPNVVVLSGYRVTELLGQERLERVAVERGDERAFLDADAIFADLGLLPHSGMVRRLVAVDANGFIAVDKEQATTVPGLYAAGDVSTTFSEHIVIALGDGTRAAVSAYDYLLAQPPESD